MAARGDINIEEVIPKLPDRWDRVSFEEVLDRAGEFTKLRSDVISDSGNFPVVDQGEKFITGYVDDSALLYKGDLPVIIFGDHTRIVKYIDFEFAAGADGTKILRPKSIVLPKFFFYYVDCLKVPSLGYSRHFKILRELPVPIPPLPEQKRIVAKLDTLFAHLDQLKGRLEKIPGLLKQFRQAVLTQAVTGKLTEEAENDELDDLKLEGDFKLPLKWKWSLIQEVANLINGDRGINYPNVNEYVALGIPWINTGHIDPKGTLSSERMNFITREKFDSLGSGKVKKGDLVYCLRGATLGKTAIVNYEEGAIASSLVIIRPNEMTITKYLYYFLVSPYGQELIGRFDNGTAQPNLAGKSVSQYPIPLPPIGEQKEIILRVESLFAVADRIEASYKTLREKIDKLPQTILSKAFRGELLM